MLLLAITAAAQKTTKEQVARRQRGLGAITTEAAKAHVYFLASDLLKG